MSLDLAFTPSHRATLVALAGSAALHGAVILGSPVADHSPVELDAPAYTARIEGQSAADARAAKPAPRAAKARARARYQPRIEEPIAPLPQVVEEPAPAAPTEREIVADALETDDAAPSPQAEPPEALALAAPSAPAPVADLPRFDPAAIPARVTILYDLNSSFADGTAEYSWSRDGDRYEITGEAMAQGFFALFLEGSIRQESRGRVTAEGLRPDSFSERRGNAPEEGLAFDWDKRTVTFQRGEASRTGALTDDTVDWLSMIFQLAHTRPLGDVLSMRVFTQRRMYAFRLQVVGVETLHLPMGSTQTLHLRHEGEKPEETVDVWLGIEHNYLPVKMRYPIAKNRLIVEQTARRITSR